MIVTQKDLFNLEIPEYPSVHAVGNQEILPKIEVAFFCSARCPGDVILKSYDQAHEWRERGVVVAGGFHSPVEKEVLAVLLRGAQPIVICPARGLLNMRLPAAWGKALADGRLLILSPFKPEARRPTAAMAQERNRFVAAIAPALFIAYAEPEGQLARLIASMPLRYFENPSRQC